MIQPDTSALQSVTQAVARRYSCRAFLPTPVDPACVQSILEKAQRAPSGGNLQPWHVDVLMGDVLAHYVAAVAEARQTHPRGEPPEYAVYPSPVPEPYESRRYGVGEDLYAALSVPREDKQGRLRQYLKNFTFFGAPAALMISIDRRMGPPQWADMGMYMQTVMLLAAEAGLDTCAQEIWCVWPKLTAKCLNWPPERMVFAAIALGYGDADAPVNRWRADRAPLPQTVQMHGRLK
ncbi:MAG: nitroreductase [Beijerinckiaceae bacterium]